MNVKYKMKIVKVKSKCKYYGDSSEYSNFQDEDFVLTLRKNTFHYIYTIRKLVHSIACRRIKWKTGCTYRYPSTDIISKMRNKG